MKADIILYSNVIDTVSDKGVINGGIAISGQKILAVGTREEIETYCNANTQVKEYKDCLITPGFCEAHMHLFEGAQADSEYFLSEITNSKSEKECLEMLKSYAKEHPEYPCYIGGGWFPANWNDAPLPDKYALDKVIPDKPVYLSAADYHTVWTNSIAMQEKGITKEIAEKIKGIDTFSDKEPSGIFKETARLVLEPLPSPVPEEKKDLLMLDLMKRMNCFGITSLADVSHINCQEADELLRPLKIYQKENILPMRVSIYMGFEGERFKEEELQKLVEYKETMSDDMLRMPGLKFMVDGVTSTYTAALIEPYTEQPELSGYLNASEDVYESNIIEANKVGLSVRLHSIGDYAIKKSLDWFDKGQSAAKKSEKISEVRNAVEHIEALSKEDIPRFRELNVVASIQPIHLIQDAGEKEHRIGEKRSKYEWPIHSLQKSGAMIAFGSDFPVEQYDVFRNLHAAVTRCNEKNIPVGINAKEERISMEDAIRHYTLGGAYLLGMEDRLGSLEPNKYADIAVFDRNLLNVTDQEIKETQVLLTLVNGSIVYEK
jgi:predicted amidohydrolase YtcJ